MYSNKTNVNILTALLIKHGVKHAVLCPGSRNAPIIHNLNECKEIKCYAVTDERSAGFYALGMAQYTKQGVAVCVTSGTALLNLAPAVAEAYYQHIPLIVISADRPAMWIDQFAGQTLPQPDALGRFVRKVVSLPEPTNTDERWYCNRLVNEALLASMHNSGTPVHINVPISEPLFRLDVEELPNERVIEYLPIREYPDCEAVISKLSMAKRPMIVVGRLAESAFNGDKLYDISRHITQLKESLSPFTVEIMHFDEVLSVINNATEFTPDFVVYMGDTFVSKALPKFLRMAKDAETYLFTTDDGVHDPLANTTKIARCNNLNYVIDALWDSYQSPKMAKTKDQTTFYNLWQHALNEQRDVVKTYKPAYSQMQTVQYFEDCLKTVPYSHNVHYANSTAVRLANIYAHHYVYCNRGVNGIEGSLSTAAGMSVVSPNEITFCVIGDLSFFYDQNALWNKNIGGNFRIILLNNSCGGIFHRLKGLDDSTANDEFVSAHHNTTAEGICLENNITYIKATNTSEMQVGMDKLLNAQSNRPILLEVQTDVNEDNKAIEEYYNIK